MFKPKYTIILLVISLLLGQFVWAAELIPNDPYYYQQWYLKDLHLPEVWSMEHGSAQVIIAVIDSGVDISHPDLRNNIWVNQDEILGDGLDNDNNGYIDDINGWDFINDNNDPKPKYDDYCWETYDCYEEAIIHGTFIAGVAAAVSNNSQGITGISWETKIMPLRVLSQNGSGMTEDVIEAINYAVKNKADIINLSFVGEEDDQGLAQALDYAFRSGVIIVAAAGNELNENQPDNLDVRKMYPVCYQGLSGEDIIIGVGASTQDKKLANFSNYGSSCLDVLAPGENFWGTILRDNNFEGLQDFYAGDFSGTSAAVPVVSGLAALIKSYNPTLTNVQIRDLIYNNTENIDYLNQIYQGKMGHGLINPASVFQNITLPNQARLIKSAGSAVYYVGADNRRYVFPDSHSYLSWYKDYSLVETVPIETLAQYELGGLITIKPGSFLVKMQTDPKVYVVSQAGELRWVANESLAFLLYGVNWQKKVLDISDAFWPSYKVGSPINNLADYNPYLQQNNATSINKDKGLLVNFQ